MAGASAPDRKRMAIRSTDGAARSVRAINEYMDLHKTVFPLNMQYNMFQCSGAIL
jgi:hypothetical protein